MTPATVHYLNATSQHSYTTFNSTDVPTKDFNEYSVLWTPTAITFIRNGMSIGTYSRKGNIWPFDDNVFHLVLNVAIAPSWGDVPHSNVTSFTMEVDSIKWWQHRNYKKWASLETRRMGTMVPGLPLGVYRDKSQVN